MQCRNEPNVFHEIQQTFCWGNESDGWSWKEELVWADEGATHLPNGVFFCLFTLPIWRGSIHCLLFTLQFYGLYTYFCSCLSAKNPLQKKLGVFSDVLLNHTPRLLWGGRIVLNDLIFGEGGKKVKYWGIGRRLIGEFSFFPTYPGRKLTTSLWNNSLRKVCNLCLFRSQKVEVSEVFPQPATCVIF